MVIAFWHHGVLGSHALKPAALDSRPGAGMSSFKVVGSESACLKMELSVSTSRNATPSLASVIHDALFLPRKQKRSMHDAFTHSSFIRFRIHMQEFMDAAFKSSWINSLRVLRIVV